MSRFADYRLNFVPETAQRRLDFWQALDRALDAEQIVGDLNDARRVDPELANAVQGIVAANIRLARAQLDRRFRVVEEGVSS